MRAYVTRRIPQDDLERISAHADLASWEGDEPVPRDVLLEAIADVDGLLCMLTDRIDAELISAATELRVVSQMAVGVDNIDLEACRERGIRVGHTPDVLTEAVADHAIGLLLAAARRIPEGLREVSEGRWGAWDPWHQLGVDVHGTTLGIVGMGRLGNAVARRARGFGMTVIYASRRETGEIGERLPLDDLLRMADHVVLTVPLTSETERMIDGAALGQMKESAVLVNISRGPVVDHAALEGALRSGSIFAAALDVTDPEPLPSHSTLLDLDNCLVVPHIASATRNTREAMARLATDNLLAGLDGREMPAEMGL